MKNPMSRIFRMTTTPRASPRTPARTRRALAGRKTATEMRTRPSSGILRKAVGVRPLGRSGATRATHTIRTARTVSTATTPVGSCRRLPLAGRMDGKPSVKSGSAPADTGPWVASRWLHSHHASRPNDSTSRARAPTRTAWVRASGRTSAAAIVSAIPCVAATTLRQ